MEKKLVGTQYIICECGDNFPNERLLNFHLENDHAEVPFYYHCKYCPDIFPSAQLYKHHIKQHNVQKPNNKPSQNPKLYSKSSKTDTSPENVVKKEPKSPPVVKLENEWSPVSELLQVAPEIAAEEIAETNTLPSELDEERYYRCNVCRKIFASEDFFQSHYNKVHANLLPADNDVENTQELPPDDTQEEPLESSEAQDYCIQAYQKPVDEVITESIKLEEADVSQDPEDVIYFECNLCNVLYPTEKAYSVHYKKKHGGAQFGFQLIEQDLEELCNRTFDNKRSFGVHYGRVHGPHRVKSGSPAVPQDYVCEICGRKCITNFNLVNHQRTHTGEKPFQCSECPKRFSLHQLLQIHVRTHTGERPYKCTQCPKAFVNKAALNRHDRVHTGAKPYSCQHCGKSFSQSNSMKLHVKTVHLKLPAPYKHRRNKNE